MFTESSGTYFEKGGLGRTLPHKLRSHIKIKDLANCLELPEGSAIDSSSGIHLPAHVLATVLAAFGAGPSGGGTESALPAAGRFLTCLVFFGDTFSTFFGDTFSALALALALAVVFFGDFWGLLLSTGALLRDFFIAFTSI